MSIGGGKGVHVEGCAKMAHTPSAAMVEIFQAAAQLRSTLISLPKA
jgi:hypothetical protein